MHGSLNDLLGHQAWADAMLFHAWGTSGQQVDEELRLRTDHLVTVQEAFLQLLKGQEPDLADHPLPTFEALKQRCLANHEVFLALSRGLDATALARKVRVPWFPDPPCVVSVTDALLQVCLHSQHHRGQNLTRLKALGAKTANVDYLIWLWKQKPQGRWS